MSSPAISASAGRSAAERLLEDSWERRARRASQREILVESVAGATFVAAAAGLLALTGASGLRPGVAALLLVLYTLVARIEFPVGAGHVVPTQLVLVPMLVVLPPSVVPPLVAIGLMASSTFDWALRRVPARRILSAVPDAWHALGAAAVLAAAGSPPIGFDALPLLGLAFAAACLTDVVSSLVRMRLAGAASDWRAMFGVMLTVSAVDGCLAPIGFLAARSLDNHLAAALFILPLALLLWLLARDRSQRIEQAHARLRLVEHERARLQSAVRRLGDAFAGKLELDSLLAILLHGSLEALDADAGRLELHGLPEPCRLSAGEHIGRLTGSERPGLVRLPVRFTGHGRPVTGELRLSRSGRDFDGDELTLVRELIAKAEQAAGEILTYQAIREQALTDPLTGLGNRRRLSHDLAAALERARHQRAALLLLFDLDGFKAYNDTFGHLAGDQLLARLGARLSDAIAPHGAAYRLGGDEFCALVDLPGPEGVDGLIAATADALSERGEHFAIGASLGAVVLPHEVDTPEYAIQLADERMYATKRTRGNGARSQASDVLMLTMQIKQPDLDEHAGVVARLAVRVGRRLGLTGEDLDELARAAELHDVGKVGIPDAILSKPAALDEREWAFMQQHTILGERILNAAPALRPVARLVRASHERWDGTGYPDGLAGEQIPLGARVVAVCDAYEAMTANRPYREALSPEAAVAELQAHAGTQFDPRVAEAFLAAHRSADGHLGAEPADATVGRAAAHIRSLLV